MATTDRNKVIDGVLWKEPDPTEAGILEAVVNGVSLRVGKVDGGKWSAAHLLSPREHRPIGHGVRYDSFEAAALAAIGWARSRLPMPSARRVRIESALATHRPGSYHHQRWEAYYWEVVGAELLLEMAALSELLHGLGARPVVLDREISLREGTRKNVDRALRITCEARAWFHERAAALDTVPRSAS